MNLPFVFRKALHQLQQQPDMGRVSCLAPPNAPKLAAAGPATTLNQALRKSTQLQAVGYILIVRRLVVIQDTHAGAMAINSSPAKLMADIVLAFRDAMSGCISLARCCRSILLRSDAICS